MKKYLTVTFSILIIISLTLSLGCTSKTVSKEVAEEKAWEYVNSIVGKVEAPFMEMLESEPEDLVFLYQITKIRQGYCIEFGFSYRKELGMVIRDQDHITPTTIPVFVKNNGVVDENDPKCLYMAYPKLESSKLLG